MAHNTSNPESEFNPEEAVIPLSEVETSQRYKDVYQEISPDRIKSKTRTGNTLHFLSENGFGMRLTVRHARVVRFHYSKTNVFDMDFSYAVLPLQEEKAHYMKEYEDDNAYFLDTEDLKIEINKADMRLKISDAHGNLLAEETAPHYTRSTILEGMTDVKISLKANEKEAYFGLGDKASALNLRGRSFENWNTDSFAYGADRDPLYRAIPFYYSLNNGQAYGIYLDNSYRSHFDFNSKSDGNTTFSAKGGEMNYYFIYGPLLNDVASEYMNLTGVPEMPPLWSLGFHQCRWSYHPESRVHEVANKFRELEIPCDSIYLDIDYMDGYRCFTWDNDEFPDPTRMIDELKQKGFHTVVMIDPGIRVDDDYDVYADGKEKDMFCRRTNGEVMYGPVWPPNCVWPDYTNPEVREWWGKLYEGLYNENKVSGFWNDMNEPAVFQVTRNTFPDEVRHDYDGNLTNHAKAHNIYGMQMSRATLEGLKDLQTKKRPFLLTRATFSGGQRYAALWTGDNVATWEQLEIANRQCQRLSISGFSFVGTDIGGFVDSPGGELMVRWLQLGIFHPFYRIHSSGNNLDGASEAEKDLIAKLEAENRQDQEPWAYGDDYTKHAKAAIELRYRLLPYHYTAFRQHIVNGKPIIRSLSFYDQTDAKAVANEAGSMFGEHLLVYPVTEEGAKEVEVYLPKGNWIDYFNGVRHKGKRTVKYGVTLSHSPIFVKAGAVIPHYPVMQYTNEKPVEQLTLRAYRGKELTHSELYEDAGEGYDFLNGDYSLRNFYTDGRTGVFRIKQIDEGERKSSYSTIRLEVYGLKNAPKSVTVDGEAAEFTAIENDAYVVIVDERFEKVEVRF